MLLKGIYNVLYDVYTNPTKTGNNILGYIVSSFIIVVCKLV